MAKMGKIVKKDKLSSINMAIFIAISGGLVFFNVNRGYTMFLYVLLSFIIFVKHKHEQFYKSNLFILLVLFTWPQINSILTAGTFSLNYDLLSFQLFALGTFFFVSRLNFYWFRETLLNTVKILCLFSLFFYFIDALVQLPGFLVSEKRVFLIFNLQFTPRLSSIFWEPGQLQIVLIFVLCLFTDELKVLSKAKRNLRKFSLVLLSLLLTISTTGYIALFVLICSAFLMSPIARKNVLIIPIFLLFLSFIAYVMYQTPAIQNKIEQQEVSELGGRTSLMVRINDNLALIEMSKDSPIIGYGYASTVFENKSFELDNDTSSNAWLLTSASFGVPFLIFILVCMYLNIKHWDNTLPPLAVMLVLILSQSGEYFLLFPYLLMYVYRFKPIKQQIKLVAK